MFLALIFKDMMESVPARGIGNASSAFKQEANAATNHSRGSPQYTTEEQRRERSAEGIKNIHALIFQRGIDVVWRRNLSAWKTGNERENVADSRKRKKRQ